MPSTNTSTENTTTPHRKYQWKQQSKSQGVPSLGGRALQDPAMVHHLPAAWTWLPFLYQHSTDTDQPHPSTKHLADIHLCHLECFLQPQICLTEYIPSGGGADFECTVPQPRLVYGGTNISSRAIKHTLKQKVYHLVSNIVLGA